MLEATGTENVVKFAPKRPTAKRQRHFIVEKRTKFARWFGMDAEWTELARHPKLDFARHDAEDAQSAVLSFLYDYRVRRSDIKIERVR